MLDRIRVKDVDITRNTEFLVNFLHSRSIQGNYSEGTVLHDLVVRPMASILSLLEGEISSLEKRLSVKALANEETESTGVLLDQIASNYFIERRSGTRSQGTVVLRLSSSDPIVIYPGTLFTKSLGIEFVYDEPETKVLEVVAEVGSEGFYLASVFVTGVRDFIGSGMPAGTLESMTNSPRHLDSVFTEETFSIAEGQESNFSFIQRIKSAVTNRSFNTEHGIRTVLQEAIDICRKVQVVGSGDPEMMRDFLQIGALNSIHTLGKINVYADTGFSASRSSDLSGVNIGAMRIIDIVTQEELGVKSTFQDGALVIYGDKEVSSLAGDSPFRLSAEKDNGISFSYSDYLNANSVDSSITVTKDDAFNTEHLNISFEVLTPKSPTIIGDYVESQNLIPAATDLKVYFPHVKYLKIKIPYIRHPEISADNMPLPVIKQDIASFVNTLDVEYKNLSVSNLLTYINNQYSAFIIAIDSAKVEVSFSVLLPDGNRVLYKVSSDTSFTNSTSYYNKCIQQGYTIHEIPQEGYITEEYLNSLQVGDKTCSLYLSVSNLILEEISS